jgi:hypothetical protein
VSEITLEEVEALDCSTIGSSITHYRSLLSTVRRYFKDNIRNGFGDWNGASGDFELFLYAYGKYSLAAITDAAVISRVRREYDLWLFRRTVPIYLCSFYRNALRSRLLCAA